MSRVLFLFFHCIVDHHHLGSSLASSDASALVATYDCPTIASSNAFAFISKTETTSGEKEIES